MNNRYTLTDFSELMAASTGEDKRMLEQFCKTFFALLEEALLRDQIVKIHGVGIFKLQKVERRRSVNVQTGEAVEIPQHFKIAFQPDKDLSEQVNGLFAAFESVEIDQLILPTEEQPDRDVAESGDQPDPSPAFTSPTIPLPTETLTEEVPEERELQPDSVIPVEVENVSVEVENISVEAEKILIEPEKIPEVSDPVIPETDAEIAGTSEPDEPYREESEECCRSEAPVEATEPTADLVAAVSPSPDELPQMQEPTRPDPVDLPLHTVEVSERRPDPLPIKKRSDWMIYALFFVVLILGGGGIYMALYLGGGRRASTVKIEPIPTIFDTVSTHEELMLDTSKIAPPIEIKEDSIGEPPPHRAPKTEAPKPQETVRYDEVGKGERLTLISLRNYGDKVFWIYIYEENKEKIKTPNNVAYGTKLVIPPASKYGIDPRDRESKARAQRKIDALFESLAP